MKCDFFVGQRVVCVTEHDALIRAEMLSFGIEAPVEGRIYTIRSLGLHDDLVVVFLAEIVNPVLLYDDGSRTEQGWSPERFRPVLTRKTDISIFKAMLTPAGRVPVDV